VTRVVFLALVAVFMTACSAPIIKGTLFENATLPGADASSLALTKDQAIVVLSAESTAEDESGHAACVRDAIASTGSSIRLMTASAFRDATFPWFETHDVEEAIAELKSMPSISGGIEQIGVRYVISVGGQTTASSFQDTGWSGGSGQGGGYIGKHGLMLCGAGAGGAGCLGFLAWQRTSDLSALVWDLKRGMQTAAIAAKVTGTNVMPAFVLPIPIIAPTETAACKALGYHLAQFLTTGKIPESSATGVADDESSAQ
jgi:hypothetical protein